MENKILKKRIYLFDNLKFFLIVTMVVGHIADLATGSSGLFRSVYLFIYAFHMPLFIFLSGLFNKNKDTKNKVISFVFLGFATKIVISLSKFIITGKISFTLLSDGGLPWFMFVMAIYYLMSYLFRDTDKRLVLAIFVAVACLLGYDGNVGDYLYLSRTIVFYPFFVLGEMISYEKIISLNKNKILKAVGIIVILIWAAVCIFKINDVYLLRVLFTGRNSFSVRPEFEKWGMLYRLLCYVLSVVVSFFVICVIPEHKIPLVTTFGSRTIQVYFWHWTVILLLQRTGITEMLFATSYGKVAALALGVVMTFILSFKVFGFPAENILRAGKK